MYADVTKLEPLLKDAEATDGNNAGPIIPQGGRYIWSVYAATWNGAVVTLQYLAGGTSTWVDVATANSNSAQIVVIGAKTKMRAAITGSPTDVTSELRAAL